MFLNMSFYFVAKEFDLRGRDRVNYLLKSFRKSRQLICYRQFYGMFTKSITNDKKLN